MALVWHRRKRKVNYEGDERSMEGVVVVVVVVVRTYVSMSNHRIRAKVLM